MFEGILQLAAGSPGNVMEKRIGFSKGAKSYVVIWDNYWLISCSFTSLNWSGYLKWF